jgi:penicillin-insensitive murein endopeptidase
MVTLLSLSLTAAVAVASPPQSRSIGTVSKGRLEGGVSFPASGEGFATYSYLGWSVGRQYVHSAVRAAVMAAFKEQSAADQGRTFILGETGKQEGGPFPPHQTHQNGMSVDVFMPVNEPDGNPTVVSCWPWNKFGYNLEFDDAGQMGDLQIDFETLAALLLELERQGRAHGVRIAKIIVAPEYIPLLLDTPSGRSFGALKDTLVRGAVWVRHDEHFHVDFSIAIPSLLPTQRR